ncbi:MAG: DUF6777 domain-containing protein [Acidimicrobiales bacterium]
MPAAVIAVAIAVVALVLSTTGSDDPQTASAPAQGGEIFLEPIASTGRLPAFTPNVAAPAAAPATTSTSAEPTTTGLAGTPTLQGSTGDQPGLYGGTRNQSSCDSGKLVGFLQENAAKATAWAGALGIDADAIPGFIGGLTPALLRNDTRVTNHGFDGGRASPLQSVLQAGTAVLVDSLGLPRVRCACGNPLLEPRATPASPTYTGAPWAGFRPDRLQVVRPAPAAVASFVMVDPGTEQAFARPTGTGGAADAEAPEGAVPGSATTTTTTLPPETTTTAVPVPTADITRDGQIMPSSVFGRTADVQAANAVDGKPSTSWFSAGPEGDGTTRFAWEQAGDDLITQIKIVGNGGNAKPSFRRNFGFASVQVRLIDAAGAITFERTFDLPGTPDPEIDFNPNARGRRIELVFLGSEDPTGTCGGFGELVVGATR